MNKIVCITGASAGFGEAMAEKFSSEGWNCIIIARRKERLEGLKNNLEKQYGNKVLPLVIDVTKRSEVEKLINSLPEEWKKINVLINNAGLAFSSLCGEYKTEDIEKMIDTNIKGAIYMSETIIPLMKKYKKLTECQGHIINIGSISGKDIYQNGVIYCMTKHAIAALTQGQRIDLLKDKIKVTMINPGAAETEFSMIRFYGNESKAKSVYKGYKPLYGEDIANAAYFCASASDNVCIDDITLTCLSQANLHYIDREKD